jgi:hypothetical protein
MGESVEERTIPAFDEKYEKDGLEILFKADYQLDIKLSRKGASDVKFEGFYVDIKEQPKVPEKIDHGY